MQPVLNYFWVVLLQCGINCVEATNLKVVTEVCYLRTLFTSSCKRYGLFLINTVAIKNIIEPICTQWLMLTDNSLLLIVQTLTGATWFKHFHRKKTLLCSCALPESFCISRWCTYTIWSD